MIVYRIAGLNVSISGGGAMLLERAEAYCIESAESVDIEIEVPQEFVKKTCFSHPNLTENECAYIFSGVDFYYNLIDHSGFKLHASAVVLDGQAYLFSASSGTGKSTHTALWCDYFGISRAYILNDDGPVIKQERDVFMAWGSPWSGTSPLSRNTGVPLKAIAFLEQSESDWIRPMTFDESIVRLLEQSHRIGEHERTEKLISLLEELIKVVPIYRFGCTMNRSAVETAYAAMNK